MKLSIKNKQLRIFTKIIKFMSRMSSEIYMVMTRDSVNLKVADSSETIIIYSKLKRAFFNEYDYSYMMPEDEEEEAGDENYFLLPAKYLLTALKQSANVIELFLTFETDKNPERIILSLLLDNGAKIFHNMVLFDIVDCALARYKLNPIENDTLTAVRFNPMLLNKYVCHLTKEADELELEFSKEVFCIKSSAEEQLEALHFNIKIDPTQFIHYDLEDEDDGLILAIKSNIFIRTINFASSLNECELSMTFSEPGEPFILTMKHGNAILQTTQATIVPGDRKRGKPKKKRAGNKKAAASTTVKNVTSINITEYTEPFLESPGTSRQSSPLVKKPLMSMMPKLPEPVRDNSTSTQSTGKRKSTDSILGVIEEVPEVHHDTQEKRRKTSLDRTRSSAKLNELQEDNCRLSRASFATLIDSDHENSNLSNIVSVPRGKVSDADGQLKSSHSTYAHASANIFSSTVLSAEIVEQKSEVVCGGSDDEKEVVKTIKSKKKELF